MNKPTSVSKKCSSCGIERPLTAFLVQESQLGTHYGNICSSCRRAQENKESKQIDDGSGTSERHTIDTKTKIALEHNKKQHAKESEERDFEESLQTEAEKSITREKKISHTEAEKKHRRAFLETRPNVHAKEKLLSQQIQNQKTKNAVQLAEQEQREINDLNLNTPMNTPTDRLKHQSATFKHFIAWAGEGSAIAKNLSQLERKNQQTKNSHSPADPSVEELLKNLNRGTRKK